MSNGENIKPTLDQHKEEIKREIQYRMEDLRNRLSDEIRHEIRAGLDQIRREVESIKTEIHHK